MCTYVDNICRVTYTGNICPTKHIMALPGILIREKYNPVFCPYTHKSTCRPRQNTKLNFNINKVYIISI